MKEPQHGCKENRLGGDAAASLPSGRNPVLYPLPFASDRAEARPEVRAM